MTFDEFWILYNKKTGRKRCQQKWSKLVSVDCEGIAEALPLYIKSTPDITYRKHPITWLNGECWKDEISVTEVKVVRAMGSIPISKDAEGTAQIRRAYAKRIAENEFRKANNQLSDTDQTIKELLLQGLTAFKVQATTGAPIGRIRTIKSNL